MAEGTSWRGICFIACMVRKGVLRVTDRPRSLSCAFFIRVDEADPIERGEKQQLGRPSPTRVRAQKHGFLCSVFILITENNKKIIIRTVNREPFSSKIDTASISSCGVSSFSYYRKTKNITLFSLSFSFHSLGFKNVVLPSYFSR